MRGSLKQRAPGSWTIRIYLGIHPGTGAKHYRSVTFHGTQRQAQDYAAKLIVTLREDGRPAPNPRLTVAAQLRQWLAGHAIAIEENTRDLYRHAIEAWIAPQIGAVPVAKLTARQVQGMITNLQTAGYSPQTIAHALNVLHQGLEKTGAARILADVERPKMRRRKVRPRELATVRAFLLSIAGDPWGPMILTALLTGLRRGEVLGLLWDACVLEGDEPYLTIIRARRKTKGGAVLAAPKTEDSARRVDISLELAALLTRHRAAQDALKVELGDLYVDAGYVFADPQGKPFHPDSFSHAFQRLAARAGIERMHLHELRHAFATLVLSAGFSLKILQEMLGHASISTTGNIYGHLAPGVHRPAAQHVSGLIIVKDDQKMIQPPASPPRHGRVNMRKGEET